MPNFSNFIIELKNFHLLSLILNSIIILFILSTPGYANVQINEIMYNPLDCNDIDCEWVELFNNASENINLKNCTFNNKQLANITIGPNEFLILVRNEELFKENFLHSNNNLVEFPFGLSNSGSLLSLNGTSFCNNSFDYSLYTNLANGNNFSLEKTQNNYWQESLLSGGSPGFQNSFFNEIYNNSNYNNSNYNNTVSNNTEGNNETNYLNNPSTLSSCDLALKIDVDNLITYSENFAFKVILENKNTNNQIESFYATINGEIQDINGVLIKEYSPWKNESISSIKYKDYSPNLDEGVFQITFSITELSCNDSDLSDNNFSTLIAINPNYQSPTSKFEIEKLYLDSNYLVSWGDQFQVKVVLYKGDDTKQAVELYVIQNDEIVSKKTKINLYNSFQESSLTLPIQLDSNCDGSIGDGPATLVISGLDLEESSEFEIQGINQDVCTEYIKNSEPLSGSEDDFQDPFSLSSQSSSENNVNGVQTLSDSSTLLDYQILEIPINASSNQTINLTVEINSDDSSHNYSFYAYLYKGAWCYSCNDNQLPRNDSAETIFLLAKQSYNHTFYLALDDNLNIEDAYKIKVRFYKDNQKTPFEIISNLSIVETPVSRIILNQTIENSSLIPEDSINNITSISSVASSNPSVDFTNSSSKTLTGAASALVYESTGKRTIAFVPILLLISASVLLFILWRKPYRNP